MDEVGSDKEVGRFLGGSIAWSASLSLLRQDLLFIFRERRA
jgi:hypothetical protein